MFTAKSVFLLSLCCLSFLFLLVFPNFSIPCGPNRPVFGFRPNWSKIVRINKIESNQPPSKPINEANGSINQSNPIQSHPMNTIQNMAHESRKIEMSNEIFNQPRVLQQIVIPEEIDIEFIHPESSIKLFQSPN